MEEKELEKALLEVGSRILNPPSSLDDLLHILDVSRLIPFFVRFLIIDFLLRFFFPFLRFRLTVE